ncbi:IclR family transcriptional regulator [Antricoccus suffuscus]|uniref:IclR family transcriptional regulator n=1 Tax=Antricoccus suffuscus TaxID=1629062 RepID=UPI0011B206AA|nr:IclR family transcriptional regulator [Antricoccus suffuscus]
MNTLSNGLGAVEVLADGRLTLRQLADALGLPRQTAYRIVHTMDLLGWLERRQSDDTYGLTTRLWGIGVRSHEATDLREIWAETVNRLGDQTGETVHLAVYDQGFSVYIGKHDGWHPIRSYTKLGGRSPAYCVATGKVLLAARPAEEITRLIHGDLTKFTATTMTEPSELRDELAKIRNEGHAVNSGEYRAEVGGIAVPIRSPLGDVIAAIGFSGPLERIQNKFAELLEALKKATSTR